MAAALFRVYRLSSLTSSTTLRIAAVTSFIRSCNNVASTVTENISSQKVENERSQISKATSMNTLFDLLEPKSLTVNQAIDVVSTIKRLLSEGVIKSEDIYEDEKFNAVCSIINVNIGNVDHRSLIFTLENLMAMGLTDKIPLIYSIETEIIWKIRKMNSSQLLLLLSLQVEKQSTQKRQKIIDECLEKLQRRWFELKDHRDIIMVFKLSQHFPSSFIGKVEDRAIELVENMPAVEQMRILEALGELKQRPIHLIRAIAFHISKHTQKLNVKHIYSTVSALRNLNFPDYALLQKLSTDLVAEIDNIEKSSTVGLFLTVFGQLKWRHQDILNSFTNWIKKREIDVRVQDWLALVLTAAYLDYELEDNIINACLKQITIQRVATKTAWLDFVWALVLLRKATSPHIQSVLVPEFYNAIQTTPGYHPLSQGKKLLNINAAAKFEVSKYCGPFLPEAFVRECSNHLPTNDGLKTSVINTLSNYVPLGKYLSDARYTSEGFAVDGEFLVDANCKPLPLDNYKDSSGNVSFKSCPSDAKRVAVIVQNYKDFTLHSVRLVGCNSFAVRILKKMGITVLQVPYTEYNINDTTIQRLQYLQQQILKSFQIDKKSDKVTRTAK